MSGSEPTQPVAVASEQTPTQRLPPAVGTDPGAAIHPEDPDDEWHNGPTRSGIRLGIPTAILVALVAIAAGFWGGAVAEEHHNPSATSQLATLTSRFASARVGGGLGRSAPGATGAAGGFGARAAAATGIVTGVKGQTLFLTASDGSLITVTLGPGATVDQTVAVPLSGLTTGDTAVVRGIKHADGSVTASAVTASPPGAPEATGGGSAANSGITPGG